MVASWNPLRFYHLVSLLFISMGSHMETQQQKCGVTDCRIRGCFLSVEELLDAIFSDRSFLIYLLIAGRLL